MMENNTIETHVVIGDIRGGDISFNSSIGSRLLRAARARQLHDGLVEICISQQNSRVELLSDTGAVVGMAIMDNAFKSGMELNGMRLFPSEVAVRVTHVDDELHWTGDVVGERLGLSRGLTIRWDRSLVRVVALDSNIPNAQSEEGYQMPHVPMMTPIFDFHEDFHTPGSNETSRRSSQASNPVHESSPFSQPPSNNIRDLPHVDGLAFVRQTRRRYSMQNRTRRVARERRPADGAQAKVTLISVQDAIAKGGCKRNCLTDIPARYILDVRYNAWGSKYPIRSTWVRQMLVSFYTQTDGNRRDKFVTKLDGKEVCNACYAVAVGYSQRRFKDLKKDCLIYGRVTAIHGNTLSDPVRESIRMSAAEACFKCFVDEAGCFQPHRSIRRKSDNEVLPLILLPMNTVKSDVFNYVNEEVKRICNGETISMSSFRRMWRLRYPHVQVPPFSRFSKCYHCWEYKCAMEGTTNADAKIRIKEVFMLHLLNQMEERRHYWIFKRSCYINPEMYMCIIVDGMDQNTTMVPRIRQTVKNIEHRFVKTHLCGALVHGIGLYCDVWFGAHHKHDSNQVVSTLLHVIGDVLRRKGFLPPTLRIQADNCTRENKNIYMFAMCATLVGLGFFQEVELSFLIVGHTHEDIDQRFSCISNTLKRSDVNSLKEMFTLIERGTSPTEAFVSVRLLENVWDWKKFVTPHLFTGSDSLVGITFPHHMRFYSSNREGACKVKVQHKHYCKDAWRPETGDQTLRSIPNRAERPDFATVYAADERELKALDDFIAYKDRCIQRFQYVEVNRDAKHEAQRLKQYLAEFPKKDRNDDHDSSPFWPSYASNAQPSGCFSSTPRENTNAETREITVVDQIVGMLPSAEARGYFGPRRERPSNQAVHTARRTRRHCVNEEISARDQEGGSSDPFPSFNPQTDIKTGQFVALSVVREEVEAGIPFYLGKVIEEGKNSWRLKIKVCWYCPIMREGVVEESGSTTQCYANCMESLWEPSGERHSWVPKEACIFSWFDQQPVSVNVVQVSEKRIVHGVQVEKRVRIPQSTKAHILEYIAMQTEAIDDERLQAALNTRE